MLLRVNSIEIDFAAPRGVHDDQERPWLGPSFGHSISHSHVRTKRRWNPNIQRVRAIVNGAPKRLNVCTSCLKAGKVTRNI
jgi:large subunit ribosomal protein L28